MNDHRKEASLFSVGTAIALLGVAASGGVWVGAIASDVDTLKEDKQKIEKIEDEVKQNTVKLTEVATNQEHLLAEVDKQDKKLDKILDKLEEL